MPTSLQYDYSGHPGKNTLKVVSGDSTELIDADRIRTDKDDQHQFISDIGSRRFGVVWKCFRYI